MNSGLNQINTLPMELQSRFKVLSELGKTRTSTVYAAQELLLDRKVALKILDCATPEQAERFRREARALANLKHPNIVQFYSFGCQEIEEADGKTRQLLYLAMELLEGKTLEQVLKDGPVDNLRLQEIFLPVLDALSAAHQANIIHRDLKPANIMIAECTDSSPIVKVLDFGISRQVQDNSGQTTAGAGLSGTPKYMSPEQCMGKACTVTSDVYSLACVIYEAIAAKPPFSGETAAEVMYKHIHENPPTLMNMSCQAHFSKELLAAVMAGLEKSPSERPQSVEQFRLLITKGLSSKNYAQQKRSFPIKSAGFVLLAIVLLFFVISMFSPAPKKRSSPGPSVSELVKDRRKGVDLIREECRVLRFNRNFKDSAERLVAVLNDQKRHMDKGVRYCLFDEIAKSYDGMHDLPNAEKYWRQAMENMPWDMQDQYPITMDRLCQVMVAAARVKEAEAWCNEEIKKADPSNKTLIADFKCIKARAISGVVGRKKEAMALLKQSLAVYDSLEEGRSSKIAMGAGKDFYILACELGKKELAEKDIEKTKQDVLHREAPEGGAVWNALNLSYFMEDNNRIDDAISLRKRAIELAYRKQQGTREIPKWQADIKRLEAKLSDAADGNNERAPHLR